MGFFIIAALAVTAALIVWLIYDWIRGIKYPERKSSFNMKLVFFSLFLILSVGFQRFAVGYYELNNSGSESENADSESDSKDKPPNEKMNFAELIFDSAVHAMQSFSLDEEYSSYIVKSKEMIKSITGGSNNAAVLYGGYTALCNAAAAIAGGAVLVSILSSIFPIIQLRLAYLAFWRRKYYFSELNERSLTLAKSLLKNPPDKRKPVIIFTDAYGDDEKEKEAELLSSARQIGAICLREDLTLIPKNRIFFHNKMGKRKYFLIDDEEMGNLQALTGLADERNREYIKKAEIYLFSRYDFYTQVEMQVRNRLLYEAGFQNEDLPTINPIQSYKNLVCNLLCKVPLYEPLVHKPRKDGKVDLNVTILGAGIIGTEMFLAVYWFGQMLDVDLTINVVSEDDEASFWKKIDYINPEIRLSTKKGNEILVYNKKGQCSAPYCSVNYCQADVKSWKFLELKSENGRKILDTDYFMVALGSDELNISVADKLRSYIGGQHIDEHIRSQTLRRTVIAYVVYDSELSKILNRKKRYGSISKSPDIYMQAFGSLDEVYGSENIFLSKHQLLAQEMNNAYMTVRWQNDRMVEDNEKRMTSEAKDYTHWANLSRAMHISYKVFSLGWIDHSVFDSDCVEEIKPQDPKKEQNPEEEAVSEEERKAEMVRNTEKWKDDEHTQMLRHSVSEYMLIATGKEEAAIDLMEKEFNGGEEEKEENEENKLRKEAVDAVKKQLRMRRQELADKKNRHQKLHRMAWLEHRRWNAFSRTRGFRGTMLMGKDPKKEEDLQNHELRFALDSYIGITGDHKHMTLKLHPCIMECSENGIIAEFDESGRIKEESMFLNVKENAEKFDYLDELSVYMYLEHNGYDFKQYDYPQFDYSGFDEADVVEKPDESAGKNTELDEYGKIKGIYTLMLGKGEKAWQFRFIMKNTEKDQSKSSNNRKKGRKCTLRNLLTRAK